nr:NADH dehydrogenase subunit 6 [Callimenellus fumidus]
MTLILIPNILVTLFFNYYDHPMAMTIIIIWQTLLLAIFMGTLTMMYWMSYILFLVFLGGMLILFLYITSLASNEIFSPYQNLMLMLTFSLIISPLMMLSLMDQYSWNMWSSNSDMSSTQMSNMIISYTNQPSMLIKLYNTPTSLLTMTLVVYLLLTLIIIVKITNIFTGPLRSQLSM